MLRGQSVAYEQVSAGVARLVGGIDAVLYTSFSGLASIWLFLLRVSLPLPHGSSIIRLLETLRRVCFVCERPSPNVAFTGGCSYRNLSGGRVKPESLACLSAI
mmetsp:Transcript_104030/g.293389  ORF Transcript_104030/g.293389 Transcript_104030/m.293389 type:complete len:103 (-) Transcript_104030:123-431(-)